MNFIKNKDYQKVQEHIKKIMPLLEHPAARALPYPFLTVTHTEYYSDTIYCWDVHHTAMRFAHGGNPEHLKYLVGNLLHHQESDGFTPAIIHKDNGPMHYYPRYHAPPYLMQAALMYFFQTENGKWVQEHFAQLKKYLDYYQNNHCTHLGLFRWPVSWMSGIDNDVTTAFCLPGTIIPVDINALIYLEYCSAAVLANRMNRKSDAKLFREKAQRLRRTINEVLWYDKVSSYSAYNLLSGKHHFHLGPFNPEDYVFQSCSNLIPLYARIADKEKAIKMIKKYVWNEKHFLSPFGIRSLSKSSPYYNNAVWGNPTRFDNHRMTNSNWQGPVWMVLTYFMFHALLHYGFKKEADDLAGRAVSLLASSLAKIGMFTENYNAETGEPLYALGYASWNLLADMMHPELKSGKWIMAPVFNEF